MELVWIKTHGLKGQIKWKILVQLKMDLDDKMMIRSWQTIWIYTSIDHINWNGIFNLIQITAI